MPLMVSAAAMVSAFGPDWRIACAAARAGLRRAAPIEEYEAQSVVDGSAEPPIGHAATLVTFGFENAARRLRLISAALAELATHDGTVMRGGPALGIYLVLGARQRLHSATALRGDDAPPLPAADTAEAPDPDDVPPPIIESDPLALLRQAWTCAGFAARPALRACLQDDDTCALLALYRAERELEARTIERAIVVACDSLLDLDTLNWLDNTGRLKSSGTPAGLEPGEACVAWLLERPGGTSVPLAKVLGTAFATETHALEQGRNSTGQGTARVLETLAGQHGWAKDDGAWIASDHNGETYRANDLAMGLVRARAQLPALDQPTITHAAASFGDAGAARPLVAAMTALAAFERSYAPSPHCAVLAVGMTSRRAALMLGRP